MHSFVDAKMKKKEDTYIEHFGEDLHHYLHLLEEAFDGVIREGVSRYPVFIFHQQEVNVGIPISDRKITAGNWSVNISTLEEFYIKGLVTIEQADEIKEKLYGMPPQYCFLVVSGDEGSLIFLPRDEG
jgi:hypothetical protein